MFASSRTPICCQNSRCARHDEPFAYLNLGAGDEARLICPTCGWISIIRVDRDGRQRTECRTGTVRSDARETGRALAARRVRSR